MIAADDGRGPEPDSQFKADTTGFSLSSHGMTLDAAECWWINTHAGPCDDKGSPTVCHVDDGVRHGRKDWASNDDRFFKGPSDSGA